MLKSTCSTALPKHSCHSNPKTCWRMTSVQWDAALVSLASITTQFKSCDCNRYLFTKQRSEIITHSLQDLLVSIEAGVLSASPGYSLFSPAPTRSRAQGLSPLHSPCQTSFQALPVQGVRDAAVSGSTQADTPAISCPATGTGLRAGPGFPFLPK